MSSSYSDPDLTLLKQTMLQREADGWRFTPEDVAALVARTALSKQQVEKWGSNLPVHHPGDKLVAYLQREAEDKAGFIIWFFETATVRRIIRGYVLLNPRQTLCSKTGWI